MKSRRRRRTRYLNEINKYCLSFCNTFSFCNIFSFSSFQFLSYHRVHSTQAFSTSTSLSLELFVEQFISCSINNFSRITRTFFSSNFSHYIFHFLQSFAYVLNILLSIDHLSRFNSLIHFSLYLNSNLEQWKTISS